MSRTPSPSPFTPPSSPSASCQCIPTVFSFHGRPLTGTPSANFLADTLGVSPLYRQQDSARWQGAAQVYQCSRSRAHSRAHSPAPGARSEPYLYPPSVTPHLITEHLSAIYNTLGTPLSLEEIGRANRKRHAERGGLVDAKEGGPLELEAIAAVHELASDVRSISVSEMLPRTADLIFVNVKTVEDQPFTLELTMKGWRVASLQWDSMNGDYTKVDLHTKYYENARALLEEISPAHAQYFNTCLSERLSQLGESLNHENEEAYDHNSVQEDEGLVFNFGR
uniref:GSKIP_dom domain-containing protein n=1 Tax=Ascaris lumbricoides TaxID=6252 RepID=A0A0M3ICD1_ASCLU